MSRIAFRLSNGQTSKTPTGTPVQVAPQIDQLKGATIFRNCMPNCGCEKGKMDNDEDQTMIDNARKDGKMKGDDFDGDNDACVAYYKNSGAMEESAKRVCNRIAKVKITNSGTSEGVKKAWETRQRKASDMSHEANRLSMIATMSKTSQDHLHAAKAHLDAREEHKKLAEESRDRGETASQMNHGNLSAYHHQAWERHVLASKLDNSWISAKITNSIGSPGTLDNLRKAVQAAVNEDSRFKYSDSSTYKSVGPGWNCWVQDFILGENGAPSKVVITTQNGLVKLGYTIRDDGTVVLDPGPLEKTEQVYNRGKSYQQLVSNIRLNNSGTSEGVKKAWQSRRLGKHAEVYTEAADAKTGRAVEAEKAMGKNPGFDDRMKAIAAHKDALAAHKDALAAHKSAHNYYRGIGDEESREYHWDTMKEHEDRIKTLKSKYRFANAESFELLSNSGTSEGAKARARDAADGAKRAKKNLGNKSIGNIFKKKSKDNDGDADDMDNAHYPWEKCIADNEGKGNPQKICGSIKAKYGNSTAPDVYEVAEKFMNAGKVLPKELNDKLTAKIEEDFPGLMKVSNSGTSEGVKKAWETRKGKAPVDSEAAESHTAEAKLHEAASTNTGGDLQEAHKAAAEAYHSSAKAFSSGSIDDHRRAMKDHAFAAQAYKTAPQGTGFTIQG